MGTRRRIRRRYPRLREPGKGRTASSSGARRARSRPRCGNVPPHDSRQSDARGSATGHPGHEATRHHSMGVAADHERPVHAPPHAGELAVGPCADPRRITGQLVELDHGPPAPAGAHARRRIPARPSPIGTNISRSSRRCSSFVLYRVHVLDHGSAPQARHRHDPRRGSRARAARRPARRQRRGHRAESGAPTGTLYHRFASRDDILAAAWLRALQRFHERWKRRRAGR